MPKPIIVAPMNWGLGHATRSIPVIEALLRQGAVVHLASDGVALRLLREQFPLLPFHELPSYNVRYPKGNFAINMFLQGSKVIKTYRAEKKLMSEIAEEIGAGGVITDHRLGCRVPGLPSAIIAHMVKLAPVSMFSWVLEQLHYHHLGFFDEVWVPDFDKAPGLSGEFGHSKWQHPGQRFVGPLTRMRAPQPLPEIVKDVTAVLSGPEPARTSFEAMVIEQMKAMPNKKFTLVRGLPGEKEKLDLPSHIEVHNFLSGKELPIKIMEAKLMLSRSGYSTVLDLTRLPQKAFFVPTPGQPEQELLAVWLEKSGYFGCSDQSKFSLQVAIDSESLYTGLKDMPDQDYLLEAAVTQFMARMQPKLQQTMA